MSTPPSSSNGSPNDDRSHTRAAIDGEAVPRLPNERDESSDAAGSAPRPIVEKAGADVAAGRTGTDKGEATDELYNRTLRGG